jgi:hypothetical protein
LTFILYHLLPLLSTLFSSLPSLYPLLFLSYLLFSPNLPQRLNNRSLGPGGSRGKSAAALAARKEGRSKYQFEATASDDELEDELDENLDETLEVTRRLKALAVASGDEITRHNERLVRINDKAEGLDLKILQNVSRLKKVCLSFLFTLVIRLNSS